MPLSTYAELKESIQSWTKRVGDDILTVIPDFVALAESDIWAVLRVREMENRTTLSTSTSDRFVALPTGFIKMRQLMITIDSQLYDLEFVPLKGMHIFDSVGTPSQFSVTTQIEMNRTSDQVYTLEIDYYRSLTALSNSNQTNDILTNYPKIYLAGCLAHAFDWCRMPEDASYWRGEFDKQVAANNRKSRNGRFGPAPAMRINKGMVI